MKVIKWSVITIIICIIVIQFIPKNLPVNSDDSTTNILYLEESSAEIAEIIRVSCFDCHSTQTNYPWYSKIIPIYFLVKRDVKLGRDEVNFSEWGNLSKRKKIRVLSSSKKEVEKGKMPLKIHTLVHQDAKLTDSEKQSLLSWFEELNENILDE